MRGANWSMCATCTTPSGLIDRTARRGRSPRPCPTSRIGPAGVRPRAGGCVCADDAPVGAAGGGHDRRARPHPRGARRAAADLRHPFRGTYLCTMVPPLSRILVLLLGIAPGLSAQTVHPGPGPRARLEGKWQAKTEDAIRNISVRSDRAAQVGGPVARGRLLGDSLWLALRAGVWQVSGMETGREKLTPSCVDL